MHAGDVDELLVKMQGRRMALVNAMEERYGVALLAEEVRQSMCYLQYK